MKKLLLALSIISLTVVNSQSQVLLAYWNFDDAEFTAGDATIAPVLDDIGTNSSPAAPAAAVGTQVGTVNIINSNAGAWALAQAGTTVLEIGGPYQQALSIQGTAGNGEFFTISSFNMTGLQNMTLDFAYRSTSTGMTASQWFYSLDDITYTAFGPAIASTPSTFDPFSLSLPAAVNDQATVYLRMIWNGATTAAGTGRIDNIAVRATVIPEPSVITILAFAGIGIIFLKRRLAKSF